VVCSTIRINTWYTTLHRLQGIYGRLEEQSSLTQLAKCPIDNLRRIGDTYLIFSKGKEEEEEEEGKKLAVVNYA
jgi:hypothetical protein